MALIAAVAASEAVPRWPRRSSSYKPAYSPPVEYAPPSYKTPEYKAPEYKAPAYSKPAYTDDYAKPAYTDDYAKPSYDYVRYFDDAFKISLSEMNFIITTKCVSNGTML